jgi:uncharacterized protein
MERNVTLDFVRGVAILGILLLNISAFGLPKAAYLNPAWSGSISLSDAWTWAILDLLAQVKFLTLFALLFGAGLQMLLPRGKRWIQSRLTLLALLGLFTVCCSGMAISCWPMRWWGWWLAHGARCASCQIAV